ncbi:hypothetical protein NHJ13051_001753 [Beauveria bassiana]
MLPIIAFVALASAMPIATDIAKNHQDMLPNISSTRIAPSSINIVQRFDCESDADSSSTSRDCPHAINSALRASVALFGLFILLVLIHVWQAARYNRIQAVFGMHIADDTDTSAKTCYILLEEDASPLISRPPL